MAYKSTQKTRLFGIDGRQIDPLDSTIVAQIADKSAKLTVRHWGRWFLAFHRELFAIMFSSNAVKQLASAAVQAGKLQQKISE